MKIFINEKHEIKAIHQTEDASLIEIDVDREYVFDSMSDFMILNYCYKADESGYAIYPARDYNSILEDEYRYKIDQQELRIKELEASVEMMKTAFREALLPDNPELLI